MTMNVQKTKGHMCRYIDIIYMYNPVMETRQMQATTPKDNSFFSREKEELLRAGLKPTTFCFPGRPLYQLSHRGSSAGQAESLKFVQGKWHLSPDKQGYSTSALRMYTYVYALREPAIIIAALTSAIIIFYTYLHTIFCRLCFHSLTAPPPILP